MLTPVQPPTDSDRPYPWYLGLDQVPSGERAALWATDTDIIGIHPGGYYRLYKTARWLPYDDIIEAWDYIHRPVVPIQIAASSFDWHRAQVKAGGSDLSIVYPLAPSALSDLLDAPAPVIVAGLDQAEKLKRILRDAQGKLPTIRVALQHG